MFILTKPNYIKNLPNYVIFKEVLLFTRIDFTPTYLIMLKSLHVCSMNDLSDYIIADKIVIYGYKPENPLNFKLSYLGLNYLTNGLKCFGVFKNYSMLPINYCIPNLISLSSHISTINLKSKQRLQDK